MKASLRVHCLSALLAVALGACKSMDSVSGVRSGPSGDPSSWICKDLMKEYDVKRAELVAAIASFKDASVASNDGDQTNAVASAEGENDGTSASTNEASQPLEETSTLALADSVSARIGEGEHDLPQMPEALRGFTSKGGDKQPSYDVAQCDDQYGKVGTKPSAELLERCRLVLSTFNVASNIRYEYNYGGNGRCRTNVAGSQDGLNSVRFPYCTNACRFGQSECVKCNFTAQGRSTFYICGEEADARQAVTAHCGALGEECSGKAAQCDAPRVMAAPQEGLAGDKSESTATEVSQSVAVKLQVKAEGAVALASVSGQASVETKADVTVNFSKALKNSAGQPITLDGGVASGTLTCTIGLSKVAIDDKKIATSAGLKVSLFSVSLSSSIELTEASNIKSSKRYEASSGSIPVTGADSKSLDAYCAAFARQWVKLEFPRIVAEDLSFKVIEAALPAVEAKGLKLDCYYYDGPIGTVKPKIRFIVTDVVSRALNGKVEITYKSYSQNQGENLTNPTVDSPTTVEYTAADEERFLLGKPLYEDLREGATGNLNAKTLARALNFRSGNRWISYCKAPFNAE